jgi:L-seryl-tRNA(Ser) seleniumtransferase
MNDLFERYGLRRLINVSGTETPYGGAPVCDEVIDAVRALVPHSVYMSELQGVASRVIAESTGAEAGCVTGCTAASIAISVAATMTGADLGRVEQLPDTSGMKNEVILQRGHEVTYGQNVSQNIRLTGARVVEIGAATQCAAYQLRHALTDRTTAALYVVSFLTVQHKLIDLPTFCAICHERGVPVIVDAASQSDARPYLRAGADLVLVSAHKQFASLTGGIVAGRADLVKACLYQEQGIGRPMKVGKEGVIGAIVALERWKAAGNDLEGLQAERRMERAMARLQGLRGVGVSREKKQVRLQIDGNAAGITAHGLAEGLRSGTPSIVAWHHLADAGLLFFNFTKVSDATADLVCDRIHEIHRAGRGAGSYPAAPNVGDAMAQALADWTHAATTSRQ